MSKQAEKLEAALAAGDFYGALQMYRTVIKRKVDSDALEEATKLLVGGACTLNAHGKASEATDLGTMLLKTIFEAKERPLDEASVVAVETISASFPSPPPPPAFVFARAAVGWAASSPVKGKGPGVTGEDLDADQPHKLLQARVHLLAARMCAAGGPEHRPDAQKFYLEAFAPAEFAAFLWAWAGEGYAPETDLFLARAVLQLACLGNLRDANATRDAFYKLAGADPIAATGAASAPRLDTPLSHFLRFALLTMQHDAGPLFKALSDKYSPSLARDPSGDLQAYCTTIGQRYFNIQPAQNNPMAAMMASMMGGGEGGGGGMPPGMANLLAGLGGGGGGRGGGGGMPPGMANLLAGLGGGGGPQAGAGRSSGRK